MKASKKSTGLFLNKKTIARYTATNSGNPRDLIDTSTLTISTIRKSDNF
jgi:hypothetical protein